MSQIMGVDIVEELPDGVIPTDAIAIVKTFDLNNEVGGGKAIGLHLVITKGIANYEIETFLLKALEGLNTEIPTEEV